MRAFIVAITGWLIGSAVMPAAAKPADAAFLSREAVVAWVDGYRQRPEPHRLPAAVKALSRAGACNCDQLAEFAL